MWFNRTIRETSVCFQSVCVSGGGVWCCIMDSISRVWVWSAVNNSHRTIIIVIILPGTVNTRDQFHTRGVIFTLTEIMIHFSFSFVCLSFVYCARSFEFDEVKLHMLIIKLERFTRNVIAKPLEVWNLKDATAIHGLRARRYCLFWTEILI